MSKGELRKYLRELFACFGESADLETVLIAELGSHTTVDGLGRDVVLEDELSDESGYAHRFEELMRSGYDWINVGYVGRLDGAPLVAIELPRVSVGATYTSVNFSGPQRRVVDADLDARAAVCIANGP